MQADISPARVYERVVSGSRRVSPMKKLGDATACMSPHRNVEKMFGFFSDHPEHEMMTLGQLRENSRKNLYRTHSPPPVPRRVRMSAAEETSSRHSGSNSYRDGSMSDRSSLRSSGRWSASHSPPRLRGSTKWAVPGHGNMALWGNVTQPHVSPKASWRQSWHEGSLVRAASGPGSDRMSETGSFPYSPAPSVRSFSTFGRAASDYGSINGDAPDRERETDSHHTNDTANLSASMRRSLKKAVRSPVHTTPPATALQPP